MGLFETRPIYFLVGSHESAQKDLDLRGRSRISWADRTPLTTIHYLSSSSPRECHSCDRSLSVMANQQQVDSRPWILDLVPFIVVILIAAHVLALGYWIYRLATDNRAQRRKAHSRTV
ncbi:hypothetical protein SDJN02_01295, partial [Cucurbita argyrosperma subsp. argyrosperma]